MFHKPLFLKYLKYCLIHYFFINLNIPRLHYLQNKSRSEPGNAPRIGNGHREVVCQK